MASTGVRGITLDSLGRRTIDKEHRGERIFARLGAVSQETAERHVAQEIERLEWELERRMHALPLFSDCAKRFLRESKHKRSAVTLAWDAGAMPDWRITTPAQRAGASSPALASLDRYAWRQHCRVLFQTPIAA